MSGEIVVSAHWVARCRRKAERIVAGYTAGRFPRSAAFDMAHQARHGAKSIRYDVEEQMYGRVAEVGVALALDLDPEILFQMDGPDDGFDLVLPDGRTVDVKSSHNLTSRCLIWPEDKTRIFDSQAADLLIFARVAITKIEGTFFEDAGELGHVHPVCYVPKLVFRERHEVATKQTRPPLWVGSWFMRSDNCELFDELRQQVVA